MNNTFHNTTIPSSHPLLDDEPRLVLAYKGFTTASTLKDVADLHEISAGLPAAIHCWRGHLRAEAVAIGRRVQVTYLFAGRQRLKSMQFAISERFKTRVAAMAFVKDAMAQMACILGPPSYFESLEEGPYWAESGVDASFKLRNHRFGGWTAKLCVERSYSEPTYTGNVVALPART